MAVLPILQYPDKRLTTSVALVEQFDAALQQTIADMYETLYAAENCAALAANQLGIMQRITVIDFSDEKDQPLCLVNARITARVGETNTAEGCMSVSGVYEKVKRAEKISVEAFDAEGNPLNFEADGFMAKCIQHELDHLDGVVFLDRLSPLKRKLVERKLQTTKKGV